MSTIMNLRQYLAALFLPLSFQYMPWISLYIYVLIYRERTRYISSWGSLRSVNLYKSGYVHKNSLVFEIHFWDNWRVICWLRVVPWKFIGSFAARRATELIILTEFTILEYYFKFHFIIYTKLLPSDWLFPRILFSQYSYFQLHSLKFISLVSIKILIITCFYCILNNSSSSFGIHNYDLVNIC